MVYVYIIPFVVSSLFLMIKDDNKSWIKNRNTYTVLYVLLFLTVLIKAMTGYEYLSTISIAMVSPFIFFAIKDKWGSLLLIKRIGLAAIAAISGFFTALAINITQLSLQKDSSFAEAIAFTYANAMYRTAGSAATATNEEAGLQMLLNLDYSIKDIIIFYLKGNPFYFDGNMLTLYGITATPVWKLILVFFIFSAIGYFLVKYYFSYLEKLHLAFLGALWFSMLAPISWFILGKAHSYIHLHLNYILWYCPFFLLGFAYIGFILELITRKAFDGTVGLNQPDPST